MATSQAARRKNDPYLGKTVAGRYRLEARLGENYDWPLPGQERLDCAAHIGWARFQSVEMLRQQLKDKFAFLLTVLESSDEIANAYAQMAVLLVKLGGQQEVDYSDPKGNESLDSSQS